MIRFSFGFLLAVFLFFLAAPAMGQSGDGVLGEAEGFDEVGFADFVGGALIHDDVLLVADVDQVEVGRGLLFVGRVDQ